LLKPDPAQAPLALHASYLGREFVLPNDLHVTALEDFSLTAHPGETIAIVGGRGAGKTVALRVLFGLEPPTAGFLHVEREKPLEWGAALEELDPVDLQLVPQEADAALDPQSTATEIVFDALRLRSRHSSRLELTQAAARWLAQVGLSGPVTHRPCATLSAGEKQLLAFCRAISLQPKVLGLDSPFTKIDAAGRARLTNLMLDIQAERRLIVLIASPSFEWVRFVGDRFVVLYLGRTVEAGPMAALERGARHPYTRALLGAQHGAAGTRRQLRLVLDGVSPDLTAPPEGCHFHPRCPRAAKGQCDVEAPDLTELSPGSGHSVACFFPHT
jgi:oligopeptide transport system ATP-binding protein